MREMTCSPIAWAILAMAGGMILASPSRAQNLDATSGNPALQTGEAMTSMTAGTNDPSVPMLEEINVVGTVDDLQGLDFYAPNSSASLKRKDIEEHGSRKLDQALHYQAGILGEPYGADNKVEWFKIRGFDASVSLDGTPTTPNGYFVWKPEIFGVESIEVLKGPNSLVFGASETGGAVNLITKRPHKKESLLLNAGAGNRDRLGLSADYNGIANSDGSVYYRIVAQARHEDGMQRRTDMKSYYLAPSVSFDFSDRTSLTLLGSIQHEDGRPTNGFLPAYGTIIDTPYGRINRRTNAGEPDFDRLRRTQISAGWLFSHKFAQDWSYTQNYKYSRLSLDQRNVFAYGSDGDRELLRGYTFTDGDTKTHYIDNRVSGKLRLGDAVDILPAIGIDYLKSDTSGRNNGFGWAPNLDMFAPVYDASFAVNATPYELHPKQWGLYGAVQLRMGRNWIFNAGIRHDRVKSDGTISGVESSYDMSHDSVNVGAMYISDYGISPYINYSESFKPIVGVDGYGNTYRPYEGQQTEVGIKLEPLWLDGTLTLACFDLEEKNALISDSSNIQTQGGKRTNKGVELQGDFKIMPNTAVKVSYTHNHSRQDITASQTIRTPLIPRHQASLWVSHRFNLYGGNGLTMAAGTRYNGSTEDERYYPGERISSHTLLDLMMRYEIDRNWALQLNSRNLTDKTYISGCDFYCYYGGGRTIDLQLQYRWQ